jgi:hypothetical protein
MQATCDYNLKDANALQQRQVASIKGARNSLWTGSDKAIDAKALRLTQVPTCSVAESLEAVHGCLWALQTCYPQQQDVAGGFG